MARSDLLINLVKASSRGDKSLFLKTLEAIIADERQKHHHVLADRLTEYSKLNGSLNVQGLSVPSDNSPNLFFENIPKRSFDDLLLPANVSQKCKELVEEQQRCDLLRSHNLEPRHRILLIGPPGNGKTSLAEAISNALMVPFIVVRYEGIVGSYLGETSARLRKVFDYARTRRCVLFFDEFDTLGKERGDIHETGEIKRVVSSLLLQIDNLPSHVVVVTATNHPELLDRAVWRRFQIKMMLPLPSEEMLMQLVERFEERTGVNSPLSRRAFIEKLKGTSFSEAEDFFLDVLRKSVLGCHENDLKTLFDDRLKMWQARISV